jgi:polar amino acid transport system substrate-binding protein
VTTEPADGPHPLAAELAPGGALRAAINLGNPVLAHGDERSPGGVTVDLATEIGRRLGVPVELLPVRAARDSFALLSEGRADLCFLAVDPARAEEVAFSAPYLVIEGVYVVPAGSALRSAEDVDRPGVRVGVKEGSAYDLHLSRELRHAQVVRGAEGTAVFLEQGLEVGAGIRQPLTQLVRERADLRLLDGAFMQIRQAVGIPQRRSAEAVAWLGSTVHHLGASGFVAAALRRAGQDPALAVGGAA